MSGYFQKIREENKRIVAEIKRDGSAKWVAALTAQLLWLLAAYNLFIILSPVKDALNKNILFFIGITAGMLVWKAVEKRLPSWVEEVIKGDFFFQIKEKWIWMWVVILAALNICLLFVTSVLPKQAAVAEVRKDNQYVNE